MLALAAGASAAPDAALAGLTRSEYEDYARDRFAWLTGEVRSGQRLKVRAQRDCKPEAAAAADARRACEIAKAASERTDRLLREGADLVVDLQQRLGAAPEWARVANAQLVTIASGAAAK